MNDIDRLLDEAARDAQRSVRERTPPQALTIERRSRRRTAVLATGVVLVVGVAVTGILLASATRGEVANPEEDGAITSEMILEDGIVTEEEYRAGALAVADCVTEAGFEIDVDFDRPNGHASFSSQTDNEDKTKSDEEFFRCLDLHLSRNVSLGWSAALGQLDLEELREETTAVTKCVEERTGQDFADLTYDEFGYLTEQGQQTRDAAFSYQDHEPWGRCENDLGYLEDEKAETRALLECVEQKTGEDFGEVTFDETGRPTEEGQQTLRDAIAYEDHQVWEECQAELEYQN